MSIQLQHMRRLLDLPVVHSYDVWDGAWAQEDSHFIRSLNRTFHRKLVVRLTPFTNHERASEAGSRQFAYIYAKAYEARAHRDYVFVKLDDDLGYIDTPRFQAFLAARLADRDSFLLSANVINHDYTASWPRQRQIQEDFLRERESVLASRAAGSVQRFPSTKRLSFNFAAFLGTDLPHIHQEFVDGVGSQDEWRMCCVIPQRLGRQNAIDQRFTVAHYAFGGQIPIDLIHFYSIVAPPAETSKSAATRTQGHPRTSELLAAIRGAPVVASPLRYILQPGRFISQAAVRQLWLEFGSYQGITTRAILDAGRAMGKADPVVHGFDSFLGLPEDWRPAMEGGTFSWGRAEFQAKFLSAGSFNRGGQPPFHDSGVEWHVGWFEDTLGSLGTRFPANISFLHIDCDIYRSTDTVLRAVESRLSPDALIVFDEMINYPEYEQHEMRAFLELLDRSRRQYTIIASNAAEVIRGEYELRAKLIGMGGELLGQKVALVLH